MRYLSPSSLPNSETIDLSDKKALTLLCKMLLAELELSTDGQLHIKNRPFSKSDILEYFETIKDETVLRNAAEVGKDKVLEEFLEDSQLHEYAEFNDADIYQDDRFIQWISPYFYTAFIDFVTECLQNTDEDGLKALLQNRLLLSDYDRERAWMQIGQIFENNIAQLEHFTEQQGGEGAGLTVVEIYPLISNSYIRMILLFPEAPFAALRDKYAFAIMQASILTFNKFRDHRDIARTWMENARRLSVSEELVDQAAGKIQQMQKRKRTFPVRLVVILSIFLLKAMMGQDWGCGSTNNSRMVTNFTYDNGKDSVTIHNNQQLDSLLRKIKSTDTIKTQKFH